MEPDQQQQPQPQQQQQQQTVVVVTQPQSQTIGQPQNIKDWSHGLCGCFEDCCNCMYATFCWCCFMCTLANRMDENCCGPSCCGPLYVVPMRTKLRAQYGIRGSICEDIWCVSCCPFCVAMQMSNELRTIGR